MVPWDEMVVPGHLVGSCNMVTYMWSVEGTIFVTNKVKSWCQALSPKCLKYLNMSLEQFQKWWWNAVRGSHNRVFFTQSLFEVLDFWSFKFKFLWNLWSFCEHTSIELIWKLFLDFLKKWFKNLAMWEYTHPN